jgi:hypothetical protein
VNSGSALKRWAAFLSNRREAIAAIDFFAIPTLTFGVLDCFFVIAHGRSFVFTDESQGAELFAIADHAEKCAEIVGKAARVAAEILLADEE